jgi:hypothetical protein
VEFLIQKVNKKLENTSLSVEILNERFNNDTEIHILFDMKGNSIWFNARYMEFSGRKEIDYMTPNYLEKLIQLNEDHPLCDILTNLLQDQPKDFMSMNLVKFNICS